MDLALMTSAPVPITLAGQPYNVRLLKLREWGALQAWLKASVPSPIAEALRALEQLKAAGEKLDPAIRQAVLDHAQDAARLWPPRVGSVPWITALNSVEGGTAKFIETALFVAGYTLIINEVDALEKDSSIDEIADLIRVCLHGEPPLPKSTTALTETGPDTSPITPSKPTTGESCGMGSRKRRCGPIRKSGS